MVTVEHLTGAAVAARIADLASLRIAIFREYPYLYDGSQEYEAQYLRCYVESPGAVVIVARDGGRVVVAVTGIPLAAESAEFLEPFRAAQLPVDDVY